MNSHIAINFVGMDRSEEIEHCIHAEVSKIERSFGRMSSWRIVVEAPERPHHHASPLYNVRVLVTRSNGREIVVNEYPAVYQAREDPYESLCDAFDEIRARLRE
jgi:hypothetical protein